MEITTRRFLLRDFVEADWPAFLDYQSDPRYLAFSGPEASSPEHAAHLFETFQVWASEQPRLNHQFAIVRWEEPHSLVGCCGLRRAEQEGGKAELGIELAPDYWGRYRYAVEVGRALLTFGFGSVKLEVISGVTVSANARVARLAAWFGAEVVTTRPGPAWMAERGWSQVAWRITRAQWEHRSFNRRP